MTDDALRPAVFLDRDGTLIQERVYLADPEGVVLMPGATDALRALREAGYALVVVTNQSGIARGLYGEDDYRAVARRFDELLRAAEAPVDLTLYCPHHPDFGEACRCRKPDTGMHREAAEALGVSLTESYYVGDKVADVLPAGELGGRGVLVRTGYGLDEEPGAPQGVFVVDDVGAAAKLILGGEPGVDPLKASR